MLNGYLYVFKTEYNWMDCFYTRIYNINPHIP